MTAAGMTSTVTTVTFRVCGLEPAHRRSYRELRKRLSRAESNVAFVVMYCPEIRAFALEFALARERAEAS